jgi:hypothetical protein
VRYRPYTTIATPNIARPPPITNPITPIFSAILSISRGLPIEEAKIQNLNPKLKSINKQFLPTELNTLYSQTDNWLWLLNELRNHSLHGAMINKRTSVQIHEKINSNTSISAKPEVYFLINPRDINKFPTNKPAITYLEENLQQMRDLIEAIRNKEPLLKQ